MSIFNNINKALFESIERMNQTEDDKKLQNAKDAVKKAYMKLDKEILPKNGEVLSIPAYCSEPVWKDANVKIAKLGRTKDLIKFTKNLVNILYNNLDTFILDIFQDFIGEHPWINSNYIKNLEAAKEKYSSLEPFFKALDRYFKLKNK